MELNIRIFWIQKEGNAPEDYEDAFSRCKNQDIDKSNFSVALCDGATEASFSKEWANLLARSYSSSKLDIDSLSVSNKLADKWLRLVTRKKLSWFAEEKMCKGAFASLIGITLQDTQENNIFSYEIQAVGDSCIFYFQNNKFKSSFPLTRAEEFNNAPHLISSIPKYNRQLKEHICKISSVCYFESSFILMTDALACWFLDNINEGNSSEIDFILSIEDQQIFNEKIKHLRQTSAIKNDDSTLIRLRIK